MNTTLKKALSKEAQVILESLQKAVTQTLKKKRRLAHCAVTWQDGKPLVTGEDAPKSSGENLF